MPEIYFSKRFTKKLQKISRSGNFNDIKLEKILELLAEGLPLKLIDIGSHSDLFG